MIVLVSLCNIGVPVQFLFFASSRNVRRVFVIFRAVCSKINNVFWFE